MHKLPAERVMAVFVPYTYIREFEGVLSL